MTAARATESDTGTVIPPEFVEQLRACLGLKPLPREPMHSARKLCACGRSHRALGQKCARCSGLAARPEKTIENSSVARADTHS